MRRIYARGLNIVGQINNTYKNYKQFTEIQQLAPFKVKDVGCGYLQTYFFLETGQLVRRGHQLDTTTSMRILNFYRLFPPIFYFLQMFSSFGKSVGLPFQNHDFRILNRMEVENKKIFTKACFGQSGIHIFDIDKVMYTVGENYFGQRATGDKITIQNQMRRVQYLIKNKDQKKFQNVKTQTSTQRIVDCSLGFQHTILITEKGQAYGCGKADAYQIQPYKYHHSNDLVTVMFCQTPQLIFNKRKVIKSACGYKHSLLLTQDNKLYALGLNKFGQCGLDMTKYKQITKITEVTSPDFEQEKIIDIKCGRTHSLILTNKNAYFMGLNTTQIPLLRYQKNITSPTLLDLPSRPVAIFANFDRSAIICQDSKAYIFGGRNMQYRGGESGKYQVIQTFKLNKDSVIGLGFSHTVLLP